MTEKIRFAEFMPITEHDMAEVRVSVLMPPNDQTVSNVMKLSSFELEGIRIPEKPISDRDRDLTWWRVEVQRAQEKRRRLIDVISGRIAAAIVHAIEKGEH